VDILIDGQFHRNMRHAAHRDATDMSSHRGRVAGGFQNFFN
jgi:hypothetical protein